MKNCVLISLLLFLMPALLICQPVTERAAEEGEKTKKEKKISVFELFSKDSLVTKMVLTTDLSKVLKNKYLEQYIAGELSYSVNGEPQSWKVGVAPRGKSRKKICDMPPLRLYFQKEDLENAGLKKHNTLKLVTYCKDKSYYSQYILKEYLAYKLYNILTKNSFRVKLIQLTYKDVNARFKPLVKYAFIIENTKEMAARLKAKELETYEIPRDSCDLSDYDRFSMFQYMISNTDWNMGIMHNVKIIQKKKSGKRIPIPYDFDYSGLVNTDYSVPNADYPQQMSVRQRIYIGECTSIEAMQPIADHYIEHKKEILDYCKNFDLLDKRNRKQTYKYLQKFYKTIENPKKLKRRCLKR